MSNINSEESFMKAKSRLIGHIPVFLGCTLIVPTLVYCKALNGDFSQRGIPKLLQKSSSLSNTLV